MKIEAADRALLVKALDKLGLEHSERNGVLKVQTPAGEISIANGQASMARQAQGYLNQIKVEYSAQSVETRATALGYSVVEQETEVEGEREFILRRYD